MGPGAPLKILPIMYLLYELLFVHVSCSYTSAFTSVQERQSSRVNKNKSLCRNLKCCNEINTGTIWRYWIVGSTTNSVFKATKLLFHSNGELCMCKQHQPIPNSRLVSQRDCVMSYAHMVFVIERRSSFKKRSD